MIKVSIVVTCTLISFLYLDGLNSFSEFNPLWVSLVVLFTSYIIASAFTMGAPLSKETNSRSFNVEFHPRLSAIVSALPHRLEL